jgi:hypothetical protein
VILSDQGNEFKSIVDEMLKQTDIDHVVKAFYNQRCNGLLERFNQTLMEAIRKYCDKASHEWNKWLPSISMCYRARKHSSTGFTPYMLLFGRERNKFIDYNDECLHNPILYRMNSLVNYLRLYK